MSLLVQYFCCTSRLFWRRGREKLLEICLDTVSAMLKVRVLRTENVLSLSNKRIDRLRRRLWETQSLPKKGFAAHLDHRLLLHLIPHKRPTLHMPIVTKEKHIRVLHALRWEQRKNCGLFPRKSDRILSEQSKQSESHQ